MERGWRSGPRLPETIPVPGAIECFRCLEDRRVLRLYAVSRHDKSVGSMLLCDACYASLLPLDPDPLDVTTAA